MAYNCVVYKHTAPDGRKYIGMTKCNDVVGRWGKNGGGYKNNKAFWKCICAVGWDAIKHEIVRCGLTEQDAFDLEAQLIRDENTIYPNGFNLDKGRFTKEPQSDRIRMFWEGEEPWFVLNDVCDKLMVSRTCERALEEGDKRKVRIQTTQGVHCCLFINEPAFYELLFASRAKAAEDFRCHVWDKTLKGLMANGSCVDEEFMVKPIWETISKIEIVEPQPQ